MDRLVGAAETTLPVFSIIGLGYWLGASRRFHVESFSRLTMLVASPALIFTVLSRTELRAGQWGLLVGGSVWMAVGTGALVLGLRWRDKERVRGILMPAVFWNAGNMGIPCATLALGDEGLHAAAIVFVTVAILNSTFGIWIAKGRGGGFELVRQPLFHASLAGILVHAGSIPVPRVVMEPISMLGWMAIPLMLLNLGLQLRELDLSELSSASVAVGVRMGGGFLCALLFVSVFDLEGIDRQILFLNAAMPPAIINIVLAQRYGTAPGVVASAIVLGTLASLVAIPAVVVFII